MKKGVLLYLLLFLFACGRTTESGSTESQSSPPRVNVPVFNADSAYFFVNKQVSFGPRIPNSPAHTRTGDYLIEKLKAYTPHVSAQHFKMTSFDGKVLDLENIIASFQPEKTKRILLASHWDTRPFADQDKQNPNATFDGANDGASGVGVLLEIARLLHDQPPSNAGVDIILFDGEDYGERDDDPSPPPVPQDLDSWWCLGSQYWSAHKHIPNYMAYFGVLLDMVGAKNAEFIKEGNSMTYAPSVVEKVWSTAARLGYSDIFVNHKEPEIIDDHKYVNEVAKIPMIDLVHYDQANGYFGSFHHTRADNMTLISTQTLKAVGQTLTTVVYEE